MDIFKFALGGKGSRREGRTERWGGNEKTKFKFRNQSRIQSFYWKHSLKSGDAGQFERTQVSILYILSRIQRCPALPHTLLSSSSTFASLSSSRLSLSLLRLARSPPSGRGVWARGSLAEKFPGRVNSKLGPLRARSCRERERGGVVLAG